MRDYEHKKIEKKWQKFWRDKKIYKTSDKKKRHHNFYALVEFPYPSGNLHVGHWQAFSVPDIFARYKRMRGFNVMFPMGFDAFGLPAENAAIKRGLNPRKWTYENIQYMRGQLKSMGASFDWSREVITCDPEYYKWTQWMFTQFFNKGLVYRKKTPANWCPSCKTVLANEQVVNGCCERCGAEVEKKEILQWNIKITDYAERLLNDLEKLNWPEPIKESQRNWIGRSTGAEIKFELNFEKNPLDNERRGSDGKPAHIKVFTTRPDTIFGATYLVMAPEHLWVTLATDKNHDVLLNKGEVVRYIEQTKQKTEIERMAKGKDKTGVELKGIKAINPATKEEIPIWIADYVLPQYGEGAIMAVPAHDKRDFEFAQTQNKRGLDADNRGKNKIEIINVIEPLVVQKIGEDAIRPELPFKERNAIVAIVKHWSENKYLCLQWKKIDWRGFIVGGIEEDENEITAAKREIEEETGYTKTQFRKELGGIIHSKFYHTLKNENRLAHFKGLYFELEDGSQNDISQKEKEIHDIKWIDSGDVEKFLDAEDMRMFWQRLKEKTTVYTGEGILSNSLKFNGTESGKAREEIIKFVGGRKKIAYKLRDWGVSRQRYWGVPIPIIHCKNCGEVAVPGKDLPVKLPEIKDYIPRDDGKSPLAKAEKWVSVKCPSCKGKAERETDTLDTFVDSSWYFLRYTDPKNKKEFADMKKMAHWMPVDFYSGGAEHTTMHLLYSRFWQKALFDLGLVKDAEPYKLRMNRGLILGSDGNKMSKSKGNAIDPDEVVTNLGADTVRIYLAFIGPFNEVGSYPWNTDGIVGIRRFLERVWKLQEKVSKGNGIQDETLFHQTIKKITEDIESLKMNTAVSQLMIFTNSLAKQEKVSKKEYETLLILLSPLAPHITEELWKIQNIKNKSIHLSKWPKYDTKKIQTQITIAIQINGKTRSIMDVVDKMSEKEITEKALILPEIKKRLENKEIKRIIYVKGRILNIVIS